MKQSIIELLKVRLDEQGVKYQIMDAMGTALELVRNLHSFIDYRDSFNLDTRIQTRVALIRSMKQTQAMLWELQLILGLEDIEELTTDYLKWQELKSKPH